MMKKSVMQEDGMGCGIASTAFLLGKTYKETLNLFEDGKVKAQTVGFQCKEISNILNSVGLNYKNTYIRGKIKKALYKPRTIVFIKRSKKYPYGHYLCRAEGKWMDPWINFPDQDRRAGFRKRLPGRPIYVILSQY